MTLHDQRTEHGPGAARDAAKALVLIEIPGQGDEYSFTLALDGLPRDRLVAVDPLDEAFGAELSLHRRALMLADLVCRSGAGQVVLATSSVGAALAAAAAEVLAARDVAVHAVVVVDPEQVTEAYAGWSLRMVGLGLQRVLPGVNPEFGMPGEREQRFAAVRGVLHGWMDEYLAELELDPEDEAVFRGDLLGRYERWLAYLTACLDPDRPAVGCAAEVFTVTEAEEPFDALFGAGAQVRVHRYGADGRGGLARPDLITDLRALLARHGWAAAE